MGAGRKGEERLHALDFARAGALLLGITYHAAASFMPGPAIWIVEDSHRSVLLSLLFFVTHMFRMTLFFMIAGYFARLTIERRGVRAFASNRARRIAGPFAGFWPLSLFSLGVVSVWAFAKTHPGEAPPAPPAFGPGTVPLTHLWFLYLLLWLYAGAVALRALHGALDRNGGFGRSVDRCVLLLEQAGLIVPLLAVPTIFALLNNSQWLMWFSIPTPDIGLVPNSTALVAYGTAFGFGWLAQRQAVLLHLWSERWWAMLLAAVAMTGICMFIAGAAPSISIAQGGWTTWLFATCYVLGGWSWARGTVGACMHFVQREHPAIRYVADASYWMYLVHLPIVAAVQVWLAQADLPALIKFGAVLGVSLPLMLGSYALFVRHSWIGAWLNGTRHARATARTSTAKMGVTA